MIPFVSSIKNILIGTAIGLAVGFGGGWIVKDKFVKAAIVEDIQEMGRKDAVNVIAAQENDRVLTADKNQIDKDVDSLTKEIRNDISKQKPRVAVCPQPAEFVGPPAPAEVVGRDSLSVYAVGLLNRALDPAAPDPSQWSDAEKQTLADVGLAEVAEHLAKVAKQYRQLAKDHDALVDAVEKYQKEILEARQ